MRILTAGHRYVLEFFEPTGAEGQIIQFIEKERPSPDSDELITVTNGTTNEEVLKVLINRMQHLNAKIPCRETSIVLHNLEDALLWLEKRTNDRRARGVEGKAKP